MKKRFLISLLFAFLILLLIKMNLLEKTIKGFIYCDITWVSFSDSCQSIHADAQTVDKAVKTILTNDAESAAKKLLYTDFGFMVCAYPLLYLLLIQLSTLYDKQKQETLIMCIRILAYCQILPLLADATENIFLLQSLDKGSLTVSNMAIRIIELIKWYIALLAVAVYLIATLLWAIGFAKESEKASADINY